VNGFTKPLTILFSILLVPITFVVYMAFDFLTHPPSLDDSVVVFEVKPGETFKAVAAQLEQAGLITSAWKMNLYVRLRRSGGSVRVGEYELRRNFRPTEILTVLTSGKSIEYIVTLPEGANRFEMAEILDKTGLIKKADFLRVAEDRAMARDALGIEVENLEGYLFPETYHITKYTGARALVFNMLGRFRENFKKVQEIKGWNRQGLTDHQVVTMASIVEKETGAPEERPLIASVFFNRLKKKMPLQTDPTIIYGLFLENGSWDGSLPRAELQRPGPYNTYLNQGLPPGPISNPGFEALNAVGAPAKSEFLFFVSRNDGTHTFSKDYAQHSKAVSKYWADRRAGDTKSWRDLKKRSNVPDLVPNVLTGGHSEPSPLKIINQKSKTQ
jgi:UPF0755 protein